MKCYQQQTDRFEHYKANEKRIILKVGLLFRQYDGETGSFEYHQTFIPIQLVDQVLRSLRGEFGKHPKVTDTIVAYRRKYYYQNMAQLIRKWVMSCQQCIREAQSQNQHTCLLLQLPGEHITAPEDDMQIHFVPVLSPPGGFEKTMTAQDLFSRYLFANPIPTQNAKTIFKVIFIRLTKNAYLPTTILSDKGSAFVSRITKGVAGILAITLKYATIKHVQTLSLLERSHVSLKSTLKIGTGDWRSLWHK